MVPAMNPRRIACIAIFVMGFVVAALDQFVPAAEQISNIKLADVEMRDVCILADERTQTYYAVSSTFVPATETRGRPLRRAETPG